MNMLRRAVATLSASAACAIAVAAPEPAPAHRPFRLSDLLPRSFQRDPELTVSVITEVSPAGKARPAAELAHPAYYLALDGGLVEEGDPVAGEQPPRREHLAAVMEKALAASGYLPATKEHPATLLVHYRWGSYNRLSSLQPADAETTGEDLSDPFVRRNLATRAAIVGGASFARALLEAADFGRIDFFRMQDARNDDLVAMALSDLYFVVAVGYDVRLGPNGKRDLLWITKISTDSHGLAMDETLPALASNGRRLFGHPTNGPVLTPAHLFDGKVEVGEPRVVNDAEPKRK